MGNFRAELERRIQQFTHYLELMEERAFGEAHGSCFITFEERKPRDCSGKDELSEKAEVAWELALSSLGDGGSIGGGTLDESVFAALPTEGWREDNSQNRYIQFSFERDWFCMDMPRQTLYRPEAEQILRDRTGFFYLRDRTQFTLYKEDVEGHDPFRKIYVYDDQRSAAEDMAYIFFQVWKFSVDSRFYVTASAFGDGPSWEKGFPIE